MLILDNHVHSDLHPGNMLVGFQSIPNTIHEPRVFLSPEKMDQLRHIDNPKEWQEEMELIYETHVPFLYFVDVGVTSTLSPKHLFNFIDLFKSITEFDGDMISKLMIHRSKFPTSVIDIQGFSKSMQEFMNRIKKSALKLKSIHVSDILSFVFYTVRKHHVKIDGEYANVAVALMLIEGIGRQLEPDIDLLKASGPFLAQAIRTRINRNVSKTEHII
jgi:aarF domain-containing kinase